jgi:hypothetical protein
MTACASHQPVQSQSEGHPDVPLQCAQAATISAAGDRSIATDQFRVCVAQWLSNPKTAPMK